MGSQPENKILRTRRARDAIFVHPGDIEYRREVSVSPRNPAGNIDTQIPAGTILDKRTLDGLLYPCKRDTEQSGTTNANVVNVSDVRQFVLGDWVELPESVSEGADRFRQIMAIDESNNQITLGGSSFSLSSGDVVRVIPSRPVDSVQNAGTNTQNTVDVADGSKFSVGDRIDIGPATAQFTLSLPDGSYSGTVSVSVQILDGDGASLHDIEAEVDASSATEDTIMSELQSQLDDQLSNYDGGSLGSVSTAAGPPATLTLSLAEPDHDFTYTWSANEISGTISASGDDSTAVEITSISGNTLTLAKTLTFSNGERIVGGPTGKWTIAEETMTIEGPWDEVPQNVLMASRDRGEVKRHLLKGLVAEAEQALTHVKFSSIQT